MIQSKLRHVLLAGHRKGHGIHSPYLYRQVNQVFYNTYRFYCFDAIERDVSATPNEHRMAQIVFRLAVDIEASNMVVCFGTSTLDTVYLKAVRADANIVHLTDPKKLNTLSGVDLLVMNACPDTGELLGCIDHLVSKAKQGSVFIIKHIHEKGMEPCWNTFIKHPGVNASLDAYHFGMLYFKTDLFNKNYLIKV